MKRNFSTNLLLIAGCSALIGLAGCGAKTAPAGATGSLTANATSDTEFAKISFTSLTEGETSVESSIDWENFRSSGMKVGDIYAQMPDETQKSAFRKSFIESFSASFKKSGADASAVSNWRIESEAPGKTVVVGKVDNGKTIEVTVNKSGGAQKMSGLEIR